MTREMVLRAAEANPRLLIDQPGWKAVTVYGFAEAQGTISFHKDGRELEMTWYPAKYYQSYYDDRLLVSPPEPARVAGQSANVFRYDDHDFAVMLLPRGDSFTEMRTSGPWNRADFDAVLADVRRVDVPTWLAALPSEIVTPDKADQAAAEALAGVPLPPGLQPDQLDVPGANDPYQFGAEVTRRVTCGWLAEWWRADRIGDKDARQRATAALVSSRDWPVLQRMDAAGDWPESIWEIGDQVASGKPRADYVTALECP